MHKKGLMELSMHDSHLPLLSPIYAGRINFNNTSTQLFSVGKKLDLFKFKWKNGFL